MFIENKYFRVYQNLIQKRKQTPPNGYYESHHITPKSFGGTDEISNIVKLTAREHYIAHKLLTKCTEGIYNQKMHWAFHRMIFSKKYHVSSRDFEKFREIHSNKMREHHPSLNGPEWSKKVSNSHRKYWENNDERRAQNSEIMKEMVRKKFEGGGYIEELKRRAKIGGEKSGELKSKDIEYNGVMYKGWDDFEEKTGLSKHLYVRFYLNGIDPSFRKGKDGPLKMEELEELVVKFCNLNKENIPIDKDSYALILERMQAVGLVSKFVSDNFLKKRF